MQALIKPLVPSELNPPLNAMLVNDGASLDKFARFIKRVGESDAPIVGMDYETNITPDFFHRKARTLQIGNRDEQHVIDFLAFADGNTDKLIDAQGHRGKSAQIFKPVLDIVNPVLDSKHFLKCGVNLTFEYEVSLWAFGMRLWNVYSADLVERAIVAGLVSLKRYAHFSMAAMVERYFSLLIDKDLQESFNLTDPLTADQITYAALDTRLPIALRAKQLEIIKRDRLTSTAMLENDSMGSFADMHINGQRMDRDKWIARYERNKVNLAAVAKQLDTHFIPVCGRVSDVPLMIAQLADLEKAWRDLAVVSPEELELAKQIKQSLKNPERKTQLMTERDALVNKRKEHKDAAKVAKSTYSKRLTVVKKIAEKSQGEALINLNSGDQLREALLSMKIKGVSEKSLESTDADALENLSHLHPVFACLLEKSKLTKQVTTYGIQWVTPWTTKPCNDEGWLHPGDGRLHGVINQFDAETGRSSSEKPNLQNLPKEDEVRACFIVDPPDEEEPEGYAMVTADMSGAELRIIAELANAETWITAFNKKWDVHSVGTEILYPVEWPNARLDDCAYFLKDHKKCKCPKHEILRNDNKATNFLLCYGGGADALGATIGKTRDEAQDLLDLHRRKFPDIWNYLDAAGQMATQKFEARTMFDRRRLFARPDWKSAEQFYSDQYQDRLAYPEEEQKKITTRFMDANARKMTNDEKDALLYRKPDSKQISQALKIMRGMIERAGKNMGVQGTNADIAKRALGSGFDKNGKPYLWHLALQYKAKFLNFVHDEIVSQVPKRLAEAWAAEIQDAFRRAGAEVMKRVVMESEFRIAERWQK